MVYLLLMVLVFPPAHAYSACYECDLLKRGWGFYKQDQYDSAAFYFERALRESEASNNSTYVAYSLINLANTYQRGGDYKLSISYNLKAFEAFQESQDYAQQFHCLRNLAINYNNTGQFRTSLEYLKRAQQVIEKLKEPQLAYLYYSTLGRTQSELDDLEKASISFLKAREIAFSSQLPNEMNEAVINIGNLYLMTGKLDSAEQFFKESYASAAQLRDSIRMGMASNNLGEIALRRGRLDQAALHLKEAVDIKRQVNPAKLSSTHVRLARLYLMKGDLRSSKSYLDSTMTDARRTSDMEILFPAYEVHVDYYTRLGELREAMQYMVLLDSLKTKRFNIEKLEANKLQASYDLEDANQKLEQQVLITQSHQRATIISVVVGIVIFVLAVIFYQLFRSNLRLRRKNELLYREQNHRVKNNLQMINSLLSLQSQKLLTTDAKDALNESQLRINSVALLHRMLYQGDEIGTIHAREYVKTLTDEIAYAVPRNIEINLQIDDQINLAIEMATSLGLIINELVTNSIKHVDGAVGLVIRISIIAKESGEITLNYSDNGDGVDEKTWRSSTSFGNQLIRLQSEQLRGKYAVKNKTGFEYKLKMGA